jgi:hypothetical protein
VEPAALRARDLYRRGEHQREAQDVDVWLAERYSRVPP